MGNQPVNTPRIDRIILLTLFSSGACVAGFYAVFKLGVETTWVAIGLLISALASALLSAFAYLVPLFLAAGGRRWQPATVGLLAGVATFTLAQHIPLPSPLRAVVLPLFAAAVTATLTMKPTDWANLNSAETDRITTLRHLCISAACVIGVFVGIASGVGKPVLIALDQDVIGVLQSEKNEIAVAGAFVGGILGLITGIIAVSALSARTNSS